MGDATRVRWGRAVGANHQLSQTWWRRTGAGLVWYLSRQFSPLMMAEPAEPQQNCPGLYPSEAPNTQQHMRLQLVPLPGWRWMPPSIHLHGCPACYEISVWTDPERCWGAGPEQGTGSGDIIPPSMSSMQQQSNQSTLLLRWAQRISSIGHRVWLAGLISTLLCLLLLQQHKSLFFPA